MNKDNKLLCPNCGADLKEYGISANTAAHFKFLYGKTFTIEAVDILPYDTDNYICGKCHNEIELPELEECEFII